MNKNEERNPMQDTCDIIFNLTSNLYTASDIIEWNYLAANGDISHDDLFSDLVVDIDKVTTSMDKAWWVARRLYIEMRDEWNVYHIEYSCAEFDSKKKWPRVKDLTPLADGHLAEYIDRQIQQLNLIKENGHECDEKLFTELYDLLKMIRNNIR